MNKDKLLNECAAALLAVEEGGDQWQNSMVWARNHIADTGPHHGDCTMEPIACLRCINEDALQRAKVVLHAAGVEELVTALRRFANIKADDSDDFEDWDDSVIIRCEITVGDLKAARLAIAHAKVTDDE